MDNLMDLLQSQLGGKAMDLIASQMGGGNKDATQAATSGIVSMLMSAMAKNASTPEGASSLISALDRDHDGSVLDDVVGLLGGQRQVANPRATNGEGILKHLLGQGDKRNNAVQMISQMSGLETDNVGNMMVKLAPLVLGALGKARSQGNLDSNSLTGMLSQTVQSRANADAQMGLIGKFLDRDGDGSVLDDLAQMGLNKFLKR